MQQAGPGGVARERSPGWSKKGYTVHFICVRGVLRGEAVSFLRVPGVLRGEAFLPVCITALAVVQLRQFLRKFRRPDYIAFEVDDETLLPALVLVRIGKTEHIDDLEGPVPACVVRIGPRFLVFRPAHQGRAPESCANLG